MKPVEATQPKIQGFQYSFTIKELFYFLFGKKNYPKCGGKLVRKKDYEIVKGVDLNSKSDPFFWSQINVKRYIYLYTCQQCGFRHTVSHPTAKAGGFRVKPLFSSCSTVC